MWKSVRGRNKNSVLKDEGSQRGSQIEMHRGGGGRRESILNVEHISDCLSASGTC